MNCSLLFLCLLYLSEVYADPAPLSPKLSNLDVISSDNCPPGYSKPTTIEWDKCYKVSTNFLSRSAALAQCKSENGTLATVPNSFINAILSVLASWSNATSIWLGINCPTYYPISFCKNEYNASLNYTNFYKGQPNSISSCVYLSMIGNDHLEWSTFNCGQTFQYACEVDAIPSTATPPTTVASEWSCPSDYRPFNGTCYKKFYHNDYLTHSQHAAVCAQIPGGYLATIPSKEVNDYVANMTSSCPVNYSVAFGLRCPVITFDGDTSSCVWDDQEPFVYNQFVAGDPPVWWNGTCLTMVYGVWNGRVDCRSAYNCGLCQAPVL